MTAFATDENEWQRLDLRILQNGPVVLYFRSKILSEDIAWLQNEGYLIDDFDCTKWHSESDFHNDVATRLAFPDYYGHNLNAFNDCITDLDVPDGGGRAIVVRRFDLFAQKEPRVAQDILDIMASASWHSILFGRRLLTLVQSDNPRIAFDPVGARPAIWNPREWLNKNREL